MERNDLKLIKKNYGEQMMKLCRELFPTILSEPGKLFSIIATSFAQNRDIANDIIKQNKINEFKEFVFSDLRKPKKEIVKSSPRELLNAAGYDLFECKTVEQVKAFEKYYDGIERLCTFHTAEDRLLNKNIFWLVKKDANNIKRRYFDKPKREDEYSLSVLSVQVSKGKINDVQIISRYNHLVENPNAVHGNNLSLLVPSLSGSFEKEYGFNFSIRQGKLTLSDYHEFKGKHYKYNFEKNGVYYGPNNVIIGLTEVKRHIEKTYSYPETINMSKKCFNIIRKMLKVNYLELDKVKEINEVLNNLKNELSKNRLNNEQRTNITELINRFNTITSKEQDFIDKKEIDLAVVRRLEILQGIFETNIKENITKEEIDEYKLLKNKKNYSDDETIIMMRREMQDNLLASIDDFQKLTNRTDIFPEERTVDLLDKGRIILFEDLILDRKEKRIFSCVQGENESFLEHFQDISKTELKKEGKETVITIYFQDKNKRPATIVLNKENRIKSLTMYAEKIESLFLPNSTEISEINIKGVKTIKNNFLKQANMLNNLIMDDLVEAGDNFISTSPLAKKISLESLKICGNRFLEESQIKMVKLPNLIQTGNYFFGKNTEMLLLLVPELIHTGYHFLDLNKILRKIIAPKLKTVKSNFLPSNNALIIVDFPSLIDIDCCFLEQNIVAKEVNLPNAESIDWNFLKSNNTIKTIDLPKVRSISHWFLDKNSVLNSIYTPNLEENYADFENNPNREKLLQMMNGEIQLPARTIIKS